MSELRSLLAEGITARALLEPLQSCPADASAADMREILAKRGFDVAGVQGTLGGPVIGFVTKDSLEHGSVVDHAQPFVVQHLVSDATSLSTLFTVLMNNERVFVLIGSYIGGIITRADLNKPPVRVYLFGLISLLEMHLQFWIFEEYGDDVWRNHLSATRVAKAEQLHEQRRSNNDDVDLIDCLQFCDKRDLIIQKPHLLTILGIGSAKEGRSLLRRAEMLRNQLAHSQYDIRGTGWNDLITLVEWTETALHNSDALVEERARDKAADYRNPLIATAAP